MNYNFDKLSDSYFLELDDARYDVRMHGEEHMNADESLYVHDFDTAILKLLNEFFSKDVHFLFNSIEDDISERSQVIEIINDESGEKCLGTRAKIIIKTDDGKIIETKLEDLDIIDDRDGSMITEITLSKERKKVLR